MPSCRSTRSIAAGIVIAAIAASLAAVSAQAPATTPRFYPDDPLSAAPTPLPVNEPRRRTLSAVLETVNNNLKKTGQRHPANGVLPAQGVNTLGEVMDDDWYVNRHGRRRMTIAELQRGPGNANPPTPDGDWHVLVVKPFGINPGLMIADGKNDLFVLRFDPPGYQGLATGAQMVTSNFLHALGYHVADNYVVRFARGRLVDHESGQAVSSAGRPRPLEPDDLERFLRLVPRAQDGTFQAVATRLPEGRQALLGPYQMWGTRSDDPNDIVPHEHRRDLRGLFVFAAWLNFSQVRAVTTQDILTEVDGVPRIRHYIVDTTKSLGSGAYDGAKLAWEGNESAWPGTGTVGKSLLGLGLFTPAWMRERHPDLPEVGAFGSTTFDPEKWAGVELLPPFANRLPDDTFWAARQVMTFTDDDIRALVQTGGYSKAAEDWISAVLIERRNRIGRVYLSRVLPLDQIRVVDNALAFDDLGVKYGFAEPRSYVIEWRPFDNTTGTSGEGFGAGPSIPPAAQATPEGGYVSARIHAGVQGRNVTVHLRREADGFRVVGVDRGWPAKVVVAPSLPPRADRRAYTDLAPRQRELFQTYADSYNAARGSRYTAEESFERLTVSEQTTFYAVTHAALRSQLTTGAGESLGLLIDQVEVVERIAGQYAGKGGDEQFRVFARLKPGARDVLEKSREFVRSPENTVYHFGFPHSYRQEGREPNMQVSLSEDGLRADIDVDYRSSRSPQSLFNGHLTASNSDVRAGENPDLHNRRWTGLITWWQDVFGKLTVSRSSQVDVAYAGRPADRPTPLPPDRPSATAPEKIEDAVQEFLTDWLVRRQYDQALEFLSPKAFACLNLTGDARGRALDADGARRELRRLMEYADSRLGPRPDLTTVIEAFTPRNPNQPVIDHPFKREFLLGRLPETQARQYLCDPRSMPTLGDAAQYHGAIFTFRVDGGGTLGLLWNREGGQWKIVSYQPLVP